MVATLLFWWLQPFPKNRTYTGFTHDNKTITNMITFGIKNGGPCETWSFFPFPLPFLSLSSPSSFPFLYSSFSFSLSSLMWILWSRCEASAWKNDKEKKDNVWKNHLKGLGVLQDPIFSWDNPIDTGVSSAFINGIIHKWGLNYHTRILVITIRDSPYSSI